MIDMRQEYSQVQLHKEIKGMSNKINKLETEVKLILKKIEQKESGLDKGLLELKAGRGRLYRSMKEWKADMKSGK